jgi:hypothetical protein
MWNAWERLELDTYYRSGNLKGRDLLEDSGLHGRIIIKWIFKK